jgi:hypothetical protein
VLPKVMLLNQHSWMKEIGITAAKSKECVVVLGNEVSDSGSKDVSAWNTED